MLLTNVDSNKTINHEEEKVYNNYHEYTIKDSDSKTVCTINFQKGPVKEVGVNGVTEKELLLILKDRLENFQNSSFKCSYNASTLECINNALAFTDARTKDRESRKVEGYNKV